MKSDPVSSVTTVTLFRTLPLRGTATFTEEDLARNDSVILCYGTDTPGWWSIDTSATAYPVAHGTI